MALLRFELTRYTIAAGIIPVKTHILKIFLKRTNFAVLKHIRLAVRMITPIFTNSAGWSVVTLRSSHLLAPLIVTPSGVNLTISKRIITPEANKKVNLRKLL